MSAQISQNQTVDVREFVKAENERLYNFCFGMLGDQALAEDVLLETFEVFLKKHTKRSQLTEWDSVGELKLELYRLCWSLIERTHERRTLDVTSGIDPRTAATMDTNLMAESAPSTEQVWQRIEYVDIDFRTPLILRDVLGFSDDEVMEILSCRWGVYRHRLHRGRMDFLHQMLGVEGRSTWDASIEGTS